MSYGPDLTEVIDRAPCGALKAMPCIGAIVVGVAGWFLAAGHGRSARNPTSSRTPCSGWALAKAASCSPWPYLTMGRWGRPRRIRGIRDHDARALRGS